MPLLKLISAKVCTNDGDCEKDISVIWTGKHAKPVRNCVTIENKIIFLCFNIKIDFQLKCAQVI